MFLEMGSGTCCALLYQTLGDTSYRYAATSCGRHTRTYYSGLGRCHMYVRQNRDALCSANDVVRNQSLLRCRDPFSVTRVWFLLVCSDDTTGSARTLRMF